MLLGFFPANIEGLPTTDQDQIAVFIVARAGLSLKWLKMVFILILSIGA
jgi:hypothetical protein